jgi:hypothetical protein
LSYRFVEVPTRSYLSAASLRKELFAVGAAGVVIGLSAVTVKLMDFDSRSINHTEQDRYVYAFSKLNPSFKSSLNETYQLKCDFFDGNSYLAKTTIIDESCVAERKGGVFLWGDSHAQALSFGLRNYLSASMPEVAFSQVASSGCRPHLTEDDKTSGEFKKSCDRSNNYAVEAIKRIKPNVVIMAQREQHDQNNLGEIAYELVRLGVKQVLIVGPVPQWHIDLPRIIARKYWYYPAGEIKDNNFKNELIKVNRVVKESVASQSNSRIKFISVIDQLCSQDGQCMAILDDKRTPLVFDYGHLTAEGSVYVVNTVLKPYLDEIF